MKKIFSLDMTDSENGKFDGEDFVIRRISEEIIERSNSSSEKFRSAIRESRLPVWFNALKYTALITGIILLVAIVKAVTSGGGIFENIKTGFGNAPYVFIICPIAFLIFGFMHAYGKKHSNRESETETYEQFEREQNELFEEVKRELAIPEDAEIADVLCFAYKYGKGGDVLPYSPYATHTPMEVYLYRDQENLYISNANSVFAFSLSKFKSVKDNDAEIKLLCWNKEEDVNSEKFSEYGMCYDNYGVIIAKGYSTLIFEFDGEEIEIDIPRYEKEKFMKILGT